ncbi:MAG: P-II family nitrogen regulator [Vicinamibacterales bacterium]
MMREIKAIIRRDHVSEVIGALHERPDLPGVTISYVEGVGRRHDGAGGAEFGEVQMAKLETVVATELADWVVDTIQHAASTGRPGDGKIFVSRVEHAVEIRSGKKGPAVL